MFTATGTIEIDTTPSAPARLQVTDLCGRIRADVPWDGSRADVLAGGKALAAKVYGGVRIVTTAGVRYYAEELGL